MEYLERKAKAAAADAEADPRSAEDADNLEWPPIGFNGVRQRHRIIEFPQCSNEGYFLECKEHQRHFNTPNAARPTGNHPRTPRRLSGKAENASSFVILLVDSLSSGIRAPTKHVLNQVLLINSKDVRRCVQKACTPPATLGRAIHAKHVG